MSDGTAQTGRWRHFRAVLSRQARGRSKDTIAIAVLASIAIVLTLWIFIQQKAALPSWTPFVGEDFVHLEAEFSSAQAVTPGQGQPVTIAGIRVGKVSSVMLEEGRAVVGLDVEPEHLELIHPDASLLLRPKTNLNDMAVEIEPGTAPGHVSEGHEFPISQTEPNVPFEAFLATLDGDTQRYLQLLVAGGAEGIGGRGRQLSGAFRRFQPFARYIAALNSAVAKRRRALARTIHDFGLLTEELARHDARIERFVTASAAALGDFANQQASIQEALVEFPPTLAALRSASASSNRFTEAARPALLKLIPQAQALEPAFAATERFFDETTEPIRDQIRPFTREVRPVLRHTEQGSAAFARTIDRFGESLGALNRFFNQLAYKPEGERESFLFYVPWLNHNLNASFNLADGAGPFGRGLIMVSCNAAWLAEGATRQFPFLRALVEGAHVPLAHDLPEIPVDPEFPQAECPPEEGDGE